MFRDECLRGRYRAEDALTDGFFGLVHGAEGVDLRPRTGNQLPMAVPAVAGQIWKGERVGQLERGSGAAAAVLGAGQRGEQSTP